MMILKKLFIPAAGFILATAIVLILESHSVTNDKKYAEEFQQYYHIYSLSTPKTISFAGTSIPLTEYDVAERYDKEILTNVYWQSQTLLLLKRSARYLPVIDRILTENNIPSDFKYVALAESGLQNVVSPAGAAGFWQFLDKTGKRYGLEVTEDIDERYNLEKATKAACLYFKDAYAQLHDWSLVAASYNMGIEGIRKQLQMQSVQSYYDLYLNVETSRYLFRIIAIKDICENPSKFGFYLNASDYYKPVPLVKVKADLTISNIAQWAKANGLTYKSVKLLNPWIRKPFINVQSGKAYFIDLPKDKITAGPLASQLRNDTLYFEDTKQDDIIKEDLITEIRHTVLKGETIRDIAVKYQISEDDLIKWNSLSPGKPLKEGMILLIRKSDSGNE